MATNLRPAAHLSGGIVEGAELLRLATAGSVDDGKSTLIGRLLYDTKTAFEDQLQHVEDISRRRGDVRTNLALLTDGLRAEREQGITIDVAYRYFATSRRKFIVADAPGHLQYTRNMITAASTASLSIILVDARRGLVEQSRRHAHIAALLRIPHLVFAVNKMDLIDWSERRFRDLEDELRAFTGQLGLPSDAVTILPVSALSGANVVDRAPPLWWHQGPTLLQHLEQVAVANAHASAARFPVQWVIRPQTADGRSDDRGYAGQVAGGVLRPGDQVLALPSGRATRIARIEQHGEPLSAAFAPMSVTLYLADDLDLGRGDLLCHSDAPPTVSRDLEATLCWMADRPLTAGARYALKHTTRWTRAIVTDVLDRLDISTGSREEPCVPELRANDLGRIRLHTTAPLLCDPYRDNRTTGSFLLVDEATHATVAAGMLQ